MKSSHGCIHHCHTCLDDRQEEMSCRTQWHPWHASDCEAYYGILCNHDRIDGICPPPRLRTHASEIVKYGLCSLFGNFVEGTDYLCKIHLADMKIDSSCLGRRMPQQ